MRNDQLQELLRQWDGEEEVVVKATDIDNEIEDGDILEIADHRSVTYQEEHIIIIADRVADEEDE